MFDFHQDKERYFEYQYLTARDHILPFIEAIRPITETMTVLEIGCAEAGVLKAFVERGCTCVGIELSESRTRRASELQAESVARGQLSFINRNIYDIDPTSDLERKFNLIILKDVIEHIHDQEKFIPILKNFLAPGGQIFFGFPPWHMPFGGHQQMCRSKWLGKLPYFHLLPRATYSRVLRSGGETDQRRDELLEIYDTRISIERFEQILEVKCFDVVDRKFWLLNPIYQYKFGKGPIAQAGFIGKIPYVRNFVTTAAYYLVEDRP